MAVAAALTSGISVLSGEVWAILVEIMRVRDGHLGYRTQFIPYMQIELRTFTFGIVLFFVVVAVHQYVSLRSGRGREF